MKKSLFSYLIGSVCFEAVGGQPEKFLNACLSLGVPLRNVTATDAGFTATMPARCYIRCHWAARRFRCVLRVTQKNGIGFSLYAFRGRWGIPIGMALAYSLCILFTQFIWFIQYVDCTPQQQRVLSDALYRHGIFEGTFYNNDTIRYAERYILTETDDFSWLSFNFVAGKLVVETNTREQPPTLVDKTSTDIVATQNATIIKIHLVDGYLHKQVGQSVAVGELLVEGGRRSIDGRMLYSGSEAEIWATLEKNYRITQPLQYTVDVPQSAFAQTMRLRLAFIKGINLQQESSPQTAYWQATEHEPLCILGLSLPCTIERTVFRGNVRAKITLTPQEATQLAHSKLLDAILQDLGDGYSLLACEENSVETEQSVIVSMHIVAKAQIGKKVPHKDIPLPAEDKN